MTSPMVIKFNSTAGLDLFADAMIQDQITKHFGSSILDSINKGNAGMIVTVFANTATQLKFVESDNWQSMILDKVYSSGSVIFPRHIYIKDAISGTLSIQVQ